MKDAMLGIVKQQVAARPEILFAILYGSAADGDDFRDLDIAIFVDREQVNETAEFRFESGLEAELRAALRFPVDLRVINRAPLSFRFNVIRGYPLHIADEETYYRFRERTWDEWLDFEPVAMGYFRERG